MQSDFWIEAGTIVTGVLTESGEMPVEPPVEIAESGWYHPSLEDGRIRINKTEFLSPFGIVPGPETPPPTPETTPREALTFLEMGALIDFDEPH